MAKLDKIRAHREELKRRLFQFPTVDRPMVRTITITMIKGINGKPNQWWPGYGNVAFNSDGPSGFTHFATSQEHPMEYALNSKEYKSGEYELIVK
tara:strand:+ start:171 stop:455 length:285 start_codon:yes stop_codon:yes gene_type:complete